MTNIKKLKTEDFGEAIIFPYKNNEYKISNYNNDYYINMKSLLSLREKENSKAPYDELFEDLHEEERLIASIEVNGEETVLRFVKADYLYKFKNIELNVTIKRFMTQVALFIHTNIKQNKYLKLTAELTEDLIENGIASLNGFELNYIKYDGLTYFRSKDINTFIIENTNSSATFSLSTYGKNASPINTKLFTDKDTYINHRYFTLKGIDQALRKLTIRNDSFNEVLNMLNQCVSAKEQINFKTEEMIQYRNNQLKVINGFKFCNHTILIYSLNGKPCFNIKDITKLNLFLGINDTTAQQYTELENRYKDKGIYKEEVKNVVYIAGIEKFYKLRKSFNQNYEDMFILMARHIKNTVKNLMFPANMAVYNLAIESTRQEKEEVKAQKKWEDILTKKQEEEKRQAEEAKQKEKEDMNKIEAVKIIKGHESHQDDVVWIATKELADYITEKMERKNNMHLEIVRKVETLIKNTDGLEKEFKKEKYIATLGYNGKMECKQYLISEKFAILLAKSFVHRNSELKQKYIEEFIEVKTNKKFIDKVSAVREKLENENNTVLEIPNLYDELEETNETKQELQVVEPQITLFKEQQKDIEYKQDLGVVMSSRVVAEKLGKRHADVIKQINTILTNENLRSLIIDSEYKDSKGELRKEYLLTKDGFTLYMFNIQGHNDFKMAYINRFNEMEEAINNGVTQYKLPQTYGEALRELANEVDKNDTLQLESQEMKKELEAKEEELKTTKAEVIDLQKELENIKAKVSPEGTYTINDIAAAYSLKGSDINKILDKLGVIVKSGGNWLLSKKYMGKGLERIEYITNKHGHNVASMRWTEKGKEFIENELADIGHYPSNQIIKLG